MTSFSQWNSSGSDAISGSSLSVAPADFSLFWNSVAMLIEVQALKGADPWVLSRQGFVEQKSHPAKVKSH